MNRTADPMEQLDQQDFGYGYKGILSPQQHMTLKVDGGAVWVLLATLVASLLLSAFSVGMAFRAYDMANLAERESRIAQDKYFYVAAQLAKLDPSFKTDEH